MKWKFPDNGPSVVAGVLGIGMVVVGGLLYWKSRGSSQPVHGLGRTRYQQAPVIGGYSDGNMRTTLRASRDMPIEQRIATLQDLVAKSVQDPEMRKLALQITRRCQERDQMCEAEAVYHAVKNRIRYTGDVGPIRFADGTVEGIDLYQSARRTWFDMQGGDCDDQAVLNATLLALNGIEARFRVVRQKKDPDWSHIFTIGIVNGRAVALDTTLPGNRSFNREASIYKQIDFPA